MTPQEIVEKLAASLEDRKLSRGERQELRGVFDALERDEQRADIRHRAFELVRLALDEPARELLDWLEDVVKTLHASPAQAGPAAVSEAWFSPRQDCARRIVQLLGDATGTLDLCVFTITDDRITGAILDAHRRGVAVRVITDDEKAADLGSDIERLVDAGVALRMDRSPFHMHHKFAVLDGTRVLTGSYNWTLGAARDNQENFIVTGDRKLVAAFAREFESLWQRLQA